MCYTVYMKYAIRLIGSSEFLSFVTKSGECEFVHGWDNPLMIVYPSKKEAQTGVVELARYGLPGMVEEMSHFA